MGLEKPPNNEHTIWSRWPDQKKEKIMLYYLLHSLFRSILVGTQGYRACLSFSFMDRSLGANKDIVLASIFFFQIDICRHTRISCLLFFSYWLDICSMTFSSYFSCWHMWILCLPLFSYWVYLRSMMFSSDSSMLSHVTSVSTLLQRFGWDDQPRCFLVPVSYRCTVRTRSCR